MDLKVFLLSLRAISTRIDKGLDYSPGESIKKISYQKEKQEEIEAKIPEATNIF